MNHTSETAAQWREIAPLIRVLGQPEFADACLAFLARATGTNHLALMLFDKQLKPRLIAGASSPDRNIVFDTAREYTESRYYMSDPNVRYISQHGLQTDGPLMFRITTESIRDARYREKIYERWGLLERVSWIGITGNTWYSANLYRDKCNGYYSTDELETLHDVGEGLCALFEQHIMQLAPELPLTHQRPSLDYLQRLMQELQAGLSHREIEVCARALQGMTRTGIALDLAIKPSTVATLTQRAYSKLNICSLNELFALCLQRLNNQH